MTFKIGSLYAGVGGIDKGMEQAGFEVAWANEYDAHACETYSLNHTPDKLIENDVYNLDISQLGAIDLLAAGFPCQPFSVAGYRKGFEDERGNHFEQIMKIVDALQPQVLFLENVKNFRNHDKGRTYQTAVKMIEDRGYYPKDKVLNTAEYANIPQNRERFFLVAFRDEQLADRFEFPDKIELTMTINDLIDSDKVADRFYYTQKSGIYERIVGEITRTDTLYQWRRKYVRENKSDMCPTLTANMGTGGHNVPITLTKHGIRKLTPKECFRFQGFDDIQFPDDMAVSHLYKQAGNSVTVPVIRRIAENIMCVLSPEIPKLEKPSLLEQLQEFDATPS